MSQLTTTSRCSATVWVTGLRTAQCSDSRHSDWSTWSPVGIILHSFCYLSVHCSPRSDSVSAMLWRAKILVARHCLVCLWCSSREHLNCTFHTRTGASLNMRTCLSASDSELQQDFYWFSCVEIQGAQKLACLCGDKLKRLTGWHQKPSNVQYFTI